jgi:hypothetical protein
VLRVVLVPSVASLLVVVSVPLVVSVLAMVLLLKEV